MEEARETLLHLRDLTTDVSGAPCHKICHQVGKGGSAREEGTRKEATVTHPMHRRKTYSFKLKVIYHTNLVVFSLNSTIENIQFQPVNLL